MHEPYQQIMTEALKLSAKYADSRFIQNSVTELDVLSSRFDSASRDRGINFRFYDEKGAVFCCINDFDSSKAMSIVRHALLLRKQNEVRVNLRAVPSARRMLSQSPEMTKLRPEILQSSLKRVRGHTKLIAASLQERITERFFLNSTGTEDYAKESRQFVKVVHEVADNPMTLTINGTGCDYQDIIEELENRSARRNDVVKGSKVGSLNDTFRVNRVVLLPEVAALCILLLARGTEADSILEGYSELSSCLFTSVASHKLNVTVNSSSTTWPVHFDDEGNLSTEMTLVEDGRLTRFMHTIETSSRFDTNEAGCGRAASFDHPPVVFPWSIRARVSGKEGPITQNDIVIFNPSRFRIRLPSKELVLSASVVLAGKSTFVPRLAIRMRTEGLLDDIQLLGKEERNVLTESKGLQSFPIEVRTPGLILKGVTVRRDADGLTVSND